MRSCFPWPLSMVSATPTDRRFAGWSRTNTAAAFMLLLSIIVLGVAIYRGLYPPVLGRPGAETVERPPKMVRAEASTADLSRMVDAFGLSSDADMYAMESGDAGQTFAAPVSQQQQLPHLVGIGILPERRFAILRFASGQTRVLREGEQWDEFTVSSVVSDAVHVRGTDSVHVLRLPMATN